jgi:nicotinamidase-related amidase
MKSALVLIDLQNEMVDPAGKIGAHGMAKAVAEGKVLENAGRALSVARKAGISIVHVRLAFRADYADALSRAPRIMTLKNNKAAILGEWGSEFPAAVAPLENELIVNKQCVNPFFNTVLFSWLARHEIGRLYFGGVATHMAVEHAMRAGDDAGYEVNTLRDCCTAPAALLHDHSVEKIMPAFGAVTDVAGFEAALR